ARGGREVAVIVVGAGCVAVLMDEGSLTLPVRGGSGEEACRDVLRVHFGSADAQVRVLGTAPGSSTRPVLEVWLARRVAAARDADEGARLHWLPLGELLAGAGAPTLRDPRTLAALGVAARAKALAEWTGSAPTPPAMPQEPPAGARRIRLSDVTLRTPVAPAGHAGAEPFLSGDLSLVEFNSRVLALAEDPAVPLLARVRFLSIVSATLDEFFMVRVAALPDHDPPGPDARARAPVSSHPQPAAVAGRRRAGRRRRPDPFRVPQGAGRGAALRGAPGRRNVRAGGGRHPRESEPALPGPGGGAGARVPRDPRRGPRARRASCREPAAGDRGRGQAPTLRRRRTG